jgi:hypothetical protein
VLKELCPARSNGNTHSDLPLPGPKPDEIQVSDVSAGNQQDTENGSEQNEKSWSEIGLTRPDSFTLQGIYKLHSLRPNAFVLVRKVGSGGG